MIKKDVRRNLLKGVAAVGEGLGGLLCLFGRLDMPPPLTRREAAKADADALRSDWETILGPEFGQRPPGKREQRNTI